MKSGVAWAAPLNGTTALPFVIPSEAEDLRFSGPLPGNVLLSAICARPVAPDGVRSAKKTLRLLFRFRSLNPFGESEHQIP